MTLQKGNYHSVSDLLEVIEYVVTHPSYNAFVGRKRLFQVVYYCSHHTPDLKEVKHTPFYTPNIILIFSKTGNRDPEHPKNAILFYQTLGTSSNS